MKIAVLAEDTSCGSEFGHEHGLSLYIETDKHRLLADTGASGLFADNAEKLNIDLSRVDTVILSHGHYDHGGGLQVFAKIDHNAKIYMQKNVFGDYYHGNRYIGIDKSIKDIDGVTLVDGDLVIDDELSLFTDLAGKHRMPGGNSGLTERVDGEDIPDSFAHEQCLVIASDDMRYLISGCAHNGILNILDRYREIYGGEPEFVISGFHMNKRTEYTEDEREEIIRTAEKLAKTDTVFYTGHCTGLAAYEIMKPIMGDKLILIHSGMRIGEWD